MKLFDTEQGEGRIVRQDDITELRIDSSEQQYGNAQLASYRTRSDFSHKPPVRLSLTAWISGQLHGTAGFGFWNHPFAPGSRGVHLPKAVWFFHSTPPNDMELAMGVPGHGWKCATFDATRWQFLALLPTAPIGFLLMRIPVLYRRLWPIGQHALGVSEHLLPSELLLQPHQYTIEWMHETVTFYIDGVQVDSTDRVPRAPLGFVAWIDTQYAVVTPQGKFRFGLLKTSANQSLFIENLSIETL
jgi:hypothetical protein